MESDCVDGIFKIPVLTGFTLFVRILLLESSILFLTSVIYLLARGEKKSDLSHRHFEFVWMIQEIIHTSICMIVSEIPKHIKHLWMNTSVYFHCKKFPIINIILVQINIMNAFKIEPEYIHQFECSVLYIKCYWLS